MAPIIKAAKIIALNTAFDGFFVGYCKVSSIFIEYFQVYYTINRDEFSKLTGEKQPNIT